MSAIGSPTASALAAIIAPGFFTNSAVQVAAVVGAVVAITTATVGVFTVIRGQSFAGHTLGEVGAAGGSSSYLVGISAIWGFVGVTFVAALVMEAIGIQRARGRDLATGIVLGAGYGLAALFLYLGTTHANTSGAAVTVLFGSVFALDPSNVPLVLVLGALSIGTIAALYRPLLLSSVSPDLARARGVRVGTIGALYLIAMAVAVALSALTIGAILATALLVGPAATALRLTTRPGRAIALAAAIGVGCTWLGLLLSYDSYNWPPLHHGWPASFFIVALVLAAYLLSSLAGRLRREA